MLITRTLEEMLKHFKVGESDIPTVKQEVYNNLDKKYEGFNYERKTMGNVVMTMLGDLVDLSRKYPQADSLLSTVASEIALRHYNEFLKQMNPQVDKKVVH